MCHLFDYIKDHFAVIMGVVMLVAGQMITCNGFKLLLAKFLYEKGDKIADIMHLPHFSEIEHKIGHAIHHFQPLHKLYHALGIHHQHKHGHHHDASMIEGEHHHHDGFFHSIGQKIKHWFEIAQHIERELVADFHSGFGQDSERDMVKNFVHQAWGQFEMPLEEVEADQEQDFEPEDEEAPQEFEFEIQLPNEQLELIKEQLEAPVQELGMGLTQEPIILEKEMPMPIIMDQVAQ